MVHLHSFALVVLCQIDFESESKYGNSIKILTMIIPLVIWIFIILLSHFGNGIVSSDRKFIVISFDAFKPEYLEKNITPFLENFYQNGILALNMNNVFPTKTFVNHHSIATGL